MSWLVYRAHFDAHAHTAVSAVYVCLSLVVVVCRIALCTLDLDVCVGLSSVDCVCLSVCEKSKDDLHPTNKSVTLKL